MSESTEHQKITFREAKSADELRRLLKLRYEVYRESRLAGMLSEGSAERENIDIDQFDSYSHHFGLFAESRGVEEAIGYLRIATCQRQPRVSPIAALIREIGEPAIKHPDCIYPMQTYVGSIEATQFLDNVTREGHRAVEPSRLSIIQKSRSLQASVFMLECSIAWWLRERIELAWLVCARSQARAYQRYGFQAIPAAEMVDDPRSTTIGSRMYLQPDFIPAYRRDRLDSMAQELETEGFITLQSKKSASEIVQTTVIDKPQIQNSRVA